MEGGAETGALVAAEIIADLGFEPSPELDELVQVKSVVRQPGFASGSGRRVSYRDRQRLLREASLRSRGGRRAIERPAR
jgi:hypothetical protein